MPAAESLRILQPLTEFIGRESDVRTIRRRLETERLVTIAGVGGMGKTRVAVEVATRAERSYAGGIRAFALAQAANLEDAISLTFPGLTTVSQVCAALGNSRILILLDNCEHVLEEAQAFVFALLQRCPGVTVLATSRQVLGLPSESIVMLPPLQHRALGAGAKTHKEPVAAVTEAAAVFLRRAESIVAPAALQDIDSIELIVSTVEGNPLSIELAAGRLTMLTVPQVLERLDSPLLLLRGGQYPADARHRAQSDNIKWSYDLCTPEEQAAWRALSVFQGTLSVAAVEFVITQMLGHGDGALELAEALVRKSVLVRTGDADPWFSLLVPLREYGRTQIALLVEDTAMQGIRLAWFHHLAEEVQEQWMSPRQSELHAQLTRALPDLRSTIDYALTTDSARASLLRLLVPLWRPLVEGLGAGADCLSWVTAALAAPGPVDEVSVFVMSLRAYLTALQWGTEAAAPLFHEASKGADELNLPMARIIADTARATLGPPSDETVSILENALRVDWPEFLGMTHTGVLVVLILQHYQLRNPAEAERLTDLWIGSIEETGELFEQALLYGGLAVLAFKEGDAAESIKFAKQALRLSRGLGPSVDSVLGIDALAGSHLLIGNDRTGVQLLGAADRLSEQLSVQSPVSLDITVDREQLKLDARARLGDEAYEALHAAGASLSREALIEFALEETVAKVPSTARDPRVLTRRETEIHDLVAVGMTNEQIAKNLTLSVRTVEWHVQNVLLKLGYSTRTQVAAASRHTRR